MVIEAERSYEPYGRFDCALEGKGRQRHKVRESTEAVRREPTASCEGVIRAAWIALGFKSIASKSRLSS